MYVICQQIHHQCAKDSFRERIFVPKLFGKNNVENIQIILEETHDDIFSLYAFLRSTFLGENIFFWELISILCNKKFL